MKALLFVLLMAPLFGGCTLQYSTDGKEQSVNVGFNPDATDYKAIRNFEL